jgi:hypothetical protein
LGELASVSYLLIALTKLQKEIKNLAVKMPSEIAETEYRVFSIRTASRE